MQVLRLHHQVVFQALRLRHQSQRVVSPHLRARLRSTSALTAPASAQGTRPVRRRGSSNYALRTFAAWRPLGPRVTSNSTWSPSARLLKPCAATALKWTKTSSPLSCVMKPKPFASLNHLTRPCAITRTFPSGRTPVVSYSGHRRCYPAKLEGKQKRRANWILARRVSRSCL